MSPKPSNTMLHDVEAVLPTAYGITPAEAHRRLDCWALVSIRHSLAELVKAGRAIADGPPGYRTYRRATA